MKTGPQVRIPKWRLEREGFLLDLALVAAGFDMSKDVFSSYDPFHEEHIFVQKADAE